MNKRQNYEQSVLGGEMGRKKKHIIISFISFFTCFIFLISLIISGQEDYTREEKRLFQRYKIANSLFLKGRKHFLKDNYKKAEKELRKCVEKMPEHADAYFFLSQVSYKKGNLEESLEHIEKAKENYAFIAKMKTNMEQLYILELQKQKMDKEEKLMLLKENLPKVQSVPERSKIKAGIGSIEADISSINSRINRPLSSSEEVPAGYFYFHGNILFKLKKYQEAHTQYKEAIKIDPQHGDSYNNLASIYYIARQYKKALDYLDQAEANGAKINPEFKKAVLKALGKKETDTK